MARRVLGAYGHASARPENGGVGGSGGRALGRTEGWFLHHVADWQGKPFTRVAVARRGARFSCCCIGSICFRPAEPLPWRQWRWRLYAPLVRRHVRPVTPRHFGATPLWYWFR